ncbi:MAG: DUF4440 domain-containing protein [Chitinophagaceae bacterium]
MKQLTLFKCTTACIALFFLTTGCNQSTADETSNAKSETKQAMTTKADPAQLKSEIQELEMAWAKADNARDVATVAAFYADDAISMANNAPMLVGIAAIKKDIEASMAKKAKGSTLSYDVMDVFVGGDYVTEVGKTTRKDSTGKVTTTGKYMAIWEKRNNKWICIRDIGNEDAKEK